MDGWPDQSTARGVLWWALWDNYPAKRKDEMINAFAHELAEQIRKEAREWDGWPDHINSMNIAANLIDPEVGNA